jgi:hypothetical protein
MKDTDIAWLAGLYEGEGSIGHTSKYSFFIRIKMTDQDVIEKINDIWPGNLFEEKRLAPHKTCYIWQIGKKEEVLRFCDHIYEYLGERRKRRIDEIRSIYASKPKYRNPIEHGTSKGYNQHRYQGSEPCGLCRSAEKIYRQQQYIRKVETIA